MITELGNKAAGVMITSCDQFALVSHGPLGNVTPDSRREVTWYSEAEHWTGRRLYFFSSVRYATYNKDITLTAKVSSKSETLRTSTKL